MPKVRDLVDVAAPCDEVFNVVANAERRMQLSPLWGLSLLLEVGDDYPKQGGWYRIRMTGAPFGIVGTPSQFLQSAFTVLLQIITWKIGVASRVDDGAAPAREAELPADDPQPLKGAEELEQEYIVTRYEPPHHFSYYLNAGNNVTVVWRLESIPGGTRIHYEEMFGDTKVDGENIIPTVRNVIRQWLMNIKRYNELRGKRGRRFVKWLLDSFFLRLRPDQRRMVLVILFMQVFFLVVFVVAAIGLGIAGLWF